MRTPEHLVVARPVLDEVALRVDHADDVLELVVDTGLADVEVIAWLHRPGLEQRSRRAGGGGVAPRQAANRELDAWRDLLVLRPLDFRQHAALEDEDAVRRLGEHAL